MKAKSPAPSKGGQHSTTSRYAAVSGIIDRHPRRFYRRVRPGPLKKIALALAGWELRSDSSRVAALRERGATCQRDQVQEASRKESPLTITSDSTSNCQHRRRQQTKARCDHDEFIAELAARIN